jgi:hypothetical protein
LDVQQNKLLFIPLILVFIIGFGGWVNAQPKAGDFMIGGSIAFKRDNGQIPDDPANGIEKKNFFRLAPEVGTFLSKRWEAGFYTLVQYENTSSINLFKDSVGNILRVQSKNFELQLQFGLNIKYYYPISPNFYWVNSLRPAWGTFVSGDRLQALFETDKPQQNRERFIATNWVTQLQYFVKPSLSVSLGLTPLNYTYTYNTIERFNQPDTKERGHELRFNNIATGLFIGVNFLIISDDEE